MMKMFVAMVLVGALGSVALGVDGKSLAELPVSATENALYLKGMSERPWWNKAWTRRAPLLVSSRAKVKCGKVVVDAVVDFGEPVKPEDVRVVTPWEELVDCVAERVESKSRVEVEERKDSTLRLGLGTSTSSTAIRLLFVTDLRIEENKPFLVYWGYVGERTLLSVHNKTNGQECPFSGPKTNGQECPFSGPKTNGQECPFSGLHLRVTDREVVLANRVLDVTFDNLGQTDGILKKIHIAASQTPNELLERPTGYAWTGLEFVYGAPTPWSKATVVADNPYVKTVRFENGIATIDFSLYADQPRLDYVYRLKPGNRHAYLRLSWAVGDGTAGDTFYYPSLAGKVLSLAASRDHASDSGDYPDYPGIDKWMKDGWFAIRDRERGEVVGMLFDRDTLCGAGVGGHAQVSGVQTEIGFRHQTEKGAPGEGRGAIVATMGEVSEVANEYARYCHPPVVRLGKPEGVRDIPVKRPRIDRDFCADFNVGGYKSCIPLKDAAWATNLMDHIRSLGANAIRLNAWDVKNLPFTKSHYDHVVAARAAFVKDNPGFKPAELKPWKEGEYSGEKFRELADAAHAKGIAVSLWTSYGLNGFCSYADGEGPFHPAMQALDVELQNIYADAGADVVFNGYATREGVMIPKKVQKGRSGSFWTWDDPREFFDGYETRRTEAIRNFYAASKKLHPDHPVVIMNSECSLLGRETMMTDQVGAFDTVYCEMLPETGVPRMLVHVKQAAKRLRALFDNASHTVHNHFYYYSHASDHRVFEVELPFVWGVNGFTFENLSYENYGLEQPNITGDAYRFLGYTKLGDTVAKMAPVKDVAVFRDNRAYVDDIVHNRTRKPYADATQQDARANAIFEVKGLNADIVIDPFFTAKALAKYRAVYVPEDLSFGEDRAKELLAYVKAGGGAVVEGKIGMESKSKVEVEERRTDTLRRTDTPVRSEQESNNSTLRLRLGTSTLTLTDGTVTPYGKGKIVWIKDVLTDKLVSRGPKDIQRVRDLLTSVGSVPPFTLASKDLDANLQASDEGLFLGVYNEGNECDTGVVTLGERTLLSVRGNVARASSTVCRKGVPALAEGKVTSISQGEDALATKNQGEDALATKNQGGDALATMTLYVLDMKNGTRTPLTNDTFTVSCGPKQCSYYLIGDDAFTAIPETKVATWMGAAAAGTGRKAAQLADASVDPKFRRVKAIEFVTGTAANPTKVTRSIVGAYDVVRVTKDSYRVNKFQEELETATYVHFVATSKDFDDVFAENAEALKAFLKRGGGLLFDRSVTGPKARAFLAEAGVYDPNLDALRQEPNSRARLAENVSTNSLIYPKKSEWFNQENHCNRAFPKWDREKQQVVYVLEQNKDLATAIIQDKVLGKGKVACSENQRAFNDFYENMRYAESFLTWLTGIRFEQHAENVKRQNGGPGEVVKE